MDTDTCDLLRVTEADVFPALAAINRLIHTVSARHISAQGLLAHPDVNRIWL